MSTLDDTNDGQENSLSKTLTGSDSAHNIGKTESSLHEKSKSKDSSGLGQTMKNLLNDSALHGKHPRRWADGRTEVLGVLSSPRVSLTDHEPIKRQKKYIGNRLEDEVSSKGPRNHVDADEFQGKGGDEGNSDPDDTPTFEKGDRETMQERDAKSTSVLSDGLHVKSGETHVVASAESVGQEVHSSTNNVRDSMASRIRGSFSCSQDLKGNQSIEAKHDNRWGSSLVCADLSLTEVKSQFYWPILPSMRIEGIGRGSNAPVPGKGNRSNPFDFSRTNCEEANEMIWEMSAKICETIDDTYKTHGLEQKSPGIKVAIVASAFEDVMKQFIEA